MPACHQVKSLSARHEVKPAIFQRIEVCHGVKEELLGQLKRLAGLVELEESLADAGRGSDSHQRDMRRAHFDVGKPPAVRIDHGGIERVLGR